MLNREPIIVALAIGLVPIASSLSPAYARAGIDLEPAEAIVDGSSTSHAVHIELGYSQPGIRSSNDHAGEPVSVASSRSFAVHRSRPASVMLQTAAGSSVGIEREDQPTTMSRVSVSRAIAAGEFIDFTPVIQGKMPFGILPLNGRRVTSGFGLRTHPISQNVKFHSGVDIAAPTGTPVRATSDGIVSSASWFGNYGLYVSISHGNGVQSGYAHLSGVEVVAGQTVKKGDVLGYVGSTGRSTGPHLHYEIRQNGHAVDPNSTGPQ